MEQFPCTECGACCRSIASANHLKDFDLGNGQCKFLDEKNSQCKIYMNRPLLCRIDEAYEQVFYQWYSKEEYYKLNSNACNELQVKLGIPESYRVVIK
jgi:uncharacterized protein